jgi:hypothetical protein
MDLISSKIAQAKQTQKLSKSEVQQIFEVITKGLMILGLRGDRLPTNPELQYMVNMLKEDYGNLPIGELDLAFELMVKGKLDENPETYQNFSVLYLTRMLSGYARFVMANYQEKPKELPQIEYKPEEIDIDFIYEVYRESKDKDFRRIFMALDAFNFIFKNNLYNFNVDEIYDEVVKHIKFSVVDSATRRAAKELLADDNQMEFMCRRLVVKKYFDNLNQ